MRFWARKPRKKTVKNNNHTERYWLHNRVNKIPLGKKKYGSSNPDAISFLTLFYSSTNMKQQNKQQKHTFDNSLFSILKSKRKKENLRDRKRKPSYIFYNTKIFSG